MSKHVKEDSVAYLKGWLSNLKEDPSYIKTTLLDVKRSASFIGQRVNVVDMRLERDGLDADFSDIRESIKSYPMGVLATETVKEQTAVGEGSAHALTNTQEEKEANEKNEELSRSGIHF